MSLLAMMESILEPVFKLMISIMIGIYFIFSNTIMRSLKKHDVGANIMIEINRDILNPIFMTLFIGSAVGALYFIVFGSDLLQVAGLIFLVGTAVTTVTVNVPLNNQLQRVADIDRPEVWHKYLKKWVLWNHVRTISGIIAELLLII